MMIVTMEHGKRMGEGKEDACRDRRRMGQRRKNVVC